MQAGAIGVVRKAAPAGMAGEIMVEAGGVVLKPRVENTELADSIITYIA
jgi:hypothetical protein